MLAQICIFKKIKIECATKLSRNRVFRRYPGSIEKSCLIPMWAPDIA